MANWFRTLCLFALALGPTPVAAAFEWTGPAATRHPSGNPADLADARGLAWSLRHHRHPGLPELTAHGVRVAWRAEPVGVGATLAFLGPERHRELDGGL
ncbi:MAG: hypothetical protein ACYS5V_10640, partial [Planctomycetota bacterium]